jgi:hypothetical protein
MQDNVYQKTYKMRQQGRENKNVVVSIPPEIVEKEARTHNLSIDEFVQQYRVLANFNGFEGILYKFVPANEE